MKKFITKPAGFFICILIITLLWGSPAPLIKLSYAWLSIEQRNYSETILFAGYRFLLSAIILYLILKWTAKKKRVFHLSAFRSLSKVGFVQNFLQYIFFYIGVGLSTSMITVILTGTSSLFQMVIAHFIDKDDKLTIRKILGVSVGFFGIFVVTLHSMQNGIGFGAGEWLLLFSNLAGAAGNLMARKEAAQFDIGVITFYQLFIGSLCLIGVSVWNAGIFPFVFHLSSGITLLYLSLVALVGTFGWNTLLHYHPVSKVSVFLFLIPIFGVFYSSVFLGEKLNMYTFLGLFLVCISIIIVNGRLRPKKQSISAEI